MFRAIEDFLANWDYEAEATLKIFGSLTDESLTQRFHPDVRTLGRLAWHITQSVAEMGGRTGLEVAGPGEEEAIPASAAEIVARFREAAQSLAHQVSSRWKDQDLLAEDEMYGESWARGRTLAVLVGHQAHHRAQMMILMRMAGLPVPGVYGPTKEEWATFGMPPQE
jgi:uncharacterized damage-inducible protein DinB